MSDISLNNVSKLGVISGIVYGVTPPPNKKILWYDETVSTGCPIKYYNLSTNEWEFLVPPTT